MLAVILSVAKDLCILTWQENWLVRRSAQNYRDW